MTMSSNDDSFAGISVGDLVAPRQGITFTTWSGCALVIDRMLNSMMLGEGDAEHYDPVIIVLASGRQHYVHIDDVVKVSSLEIP